MAGDLLALTHETSEGQELIVPIILGGEPVAPPPSLEDIRAHAARNLAALPDAHRRLSADASYPVTVSSALRAMADAFDREQAQSG
jgi:nicotinate phosphoribosyltransferase